MSLVDFYSAVRQIGQPHGQDDVEIATKLDEAEAWAREVLGANYNPEWTEETLPADIRTAILARLSGIYDANKDQIELANLYIDRWRDRTLA